MLDITDAIRHEYEGDMDVRVANVIIHWLKRGVPQPTWAALNAALESTMVCYGDHAKHLLPHPTESLNKSKLLPQPSEWVHEIVDNNIAHEFCMKPHTSAD